jgi:hypothetical protein
MVPTCVYRYSRIDPERVKGMRSSVVVCSLWLAEKGWLAEEGAELVLKVDFTYIAGSENCQRFIS